MRVRGEFIHHTGGVVVVGSNPAVPTKFPLHIKKLQRVFSYRENRLHEFTRKLHLFEFQHGFCFRVFRLVWVEVDLGCRWFFVPHQVLDKLSVESLLLHQSATQTA